MGAATSASETSITHSITRERISSRFAYISNALQARTTRLQSRIPTPACHLLSMVGTGYRSRQVHTTSLDLLKNRRLRLSNSVWRSCNTSTATSIEICAADPLYQVLETPIA